MASYKKNDGMGLVEVLVATAITAILGYAVTSMLLNSSKGLTTFRTATEAQDIFVSIKSFLASSDNCKASFGLIGINPVTGWASPSPFTLKDNSGGTSYTVGSEFGIGNAVKISGYRIAEKPSISMTVDKNKAMLYVQYTRKKNSYATVFENETPLWISVDGSGQITDCRSLMNDDQIWQRHLTDMTNIFYDGLSQSSPGAGIVSMGIGPGLAPSAVHIHRGNENAVLGITNSGNHEANILFCSQLSPSATNINTDCLNKTWEINTSEFGLKIKTKIASGGALAASFNFSDSVSSTTPFSGLVMPKLDASGVEMIDKGVFIYNKGLIVADRETQGDFAKNISCSAAFGGGDTNASCTGAAGAFFTQEGFALGTAFGLVPGSPSGWVGGSPGILAGESVTGGSAGAFQIGGTGMFVAENATLGDVIACYQNFDASIVGVSGANNACTRATGGFFGRHGFAVGTGVSGGSGFIIGLPGMIGGETVTGGNTGAFKVSGDGVMIASEASLADVEGCYQQAAVPTGVYTGNPCATATGGFFGKWGFAIGTGGSNATGSGVQGHVFGRPGVISGETQTGGTARAFSLSGGGVFVAANGSALGSLISCYAALAGDVTASCAGAAGAFLGKNGMALGSDTGPYVVLNPTRMELHDGAGSVVIKSDGSIDVSGIVTAQSDVRLKENIQSLVIQDELKKLMDLNPVTYNLKADSTYHKQLGFIAQEIQKIFPELVYENEKTGTLSLNYMGLIAPMTSAFQALVDLFIEFGKKQEQMSAEIKTQNIEIENHRSIIAEQAKKIAEQDYKIAKLQKVLDFLMDKK